MPNSITYVDNFNKELDEAIRHDSLTSWMDANAGRVKYDGGKTVKIPTLSVDGLADYGRTTGDGGTGYSKGSATLAYETFTMSQDRGREFHIDRHDTDETNYTLDMAKIMGTFQKEKVVPEIDAYRISKLCTAGIGAKNVDYSKTITAENVRAELKAGQKKIRKTGYNGELVAHISYDVLAELELSYAGQLHAETFANGNGVDTRIYKYDGMVLIPTPDNLLVTKIKTNTNGWAKDGSGKQVNFVIAAKSAAMAVNKCDKVKIFTPDQYQLADDYVGQYRRYHDVWITKEQAKLIYVSSSEAGA